MTPLTASHQKSKIEPLPGFSLPCAVSRLCSMLASLGVLLHRKTMHRLTARFLLLFALAGTFAPLALAATTPPMHACCRRKAAHPCHESATSDSDQLAVRGTGCCTQGAGHAVTTAQWAIPRPGMTAAFAPTADACVNESHPDAPATNLAASDSTRAPPQISLA